MMAAFGQLAEQGVALENNGDNQNAQMLAMQAMMNMPAMLGKAGAVFTIKDTTFATNKYRLDLDGAFNANQQALYGGTGSLKAIF